MCFRHTSIELFLCQHFYPVRSEIVDCLSPDCAISTDRARTGGRVDDMKAYMRPGTPKYDVARVVDEEMGCKPTARLSPAPRRIADNRWPPHYPAPPGPPPIPPRPGQTAGNASFSSFAAQYHLGRAPDASARVAQSFASRTPTLPAKVLQTYPAYYGWDQHAPAPPPASGTDSAFLKFDGTPPQSARSVPSTAHPPPAFDEPVTTYAPPYAPSSYVPAPAAFGVPPYAPPGVPFDARPVAPPFTARSI
ncbi:hypothetical protein EXIGLDRAFT_771230 [Exidia glandulosa HHB12029]|uniref:Uncharacterized protein n=1 Tax=Exidia glandulosa HHB12029 TaxID=1314781 RepID=A0A165G5W0_EXIGL|nr:hypothetical protein EXIGLDRAFT_771230 [Exidia glandulosa HHB12029]